MASILRASTGPPMLSRSASASSAAGLVGTGTHPPAASVVPASSSSVAFSFALSSDIPSPAQLTIHAITARWPPPHPSSSEAGAIPPMLPPYMQIVAELYTGARRVSDLPARTHYAAPASPIAPIGPGTTANLTSPMHPVVEWRWDIQEDMQESALAALPSRTSPPTPSPLSFPVRICDLDLESTVRLSLRVPPNSVPPRSSSSSSGGPTVVDGAVEIASCWVRFFDDAGLLERGSQRRTINIEVPGITTNGSSGGGGGMLAADPDELLDLERAERKVTDLERLLKQFEHGDMESVPWLDALALRQVEATQQSHMHRTTSTTQWHLQLSFPNYAFPVVYHEPALVAHALPPAPTGTILPMLAHTPPYAHTGAALGDADIDRENLVEAKHRHLVRTGDPKQGLADRHLKPTAAARDRLRIITRAPPTRPLTAADRDLVWRFRYHLQKDGGAVAKFVRAVTWEDDAEARVARTVLEGWDPPSIDAVLELLGPAPASAGGGGAATGDVSAVAAAAAGGTAGSAGGTARATLRAWEGVRAYAVRQLARVDDVELGGYLLQLVQALKYDGRANSTMDEATRTPVESSSMSLADLLFSRALKNMELGCQLYWYLHCEATDKLSGSIFEPFRNQFWKLVQENTAGPLTAAVLLSQHKLVTRLTELAAETHASKDSRAMRQQRLQEALAQPGTGLATLADPIPLPLDPRVVVTGVIPDRTRIFNSALSPILLVFRRADGGEYAAIWKVGDDLRQDQLVIQIWELMDRLLRRDNLNLQLTPYRVLATGPDQGFVQFIPSQSLASILLESGGSLQHYLRKYNADDSPSSSYGIHANAMDTYIRSCAGYCVITYLLGVGDRHLDNLLMTPRGNIFHVDFGYILGRDPKPFPPPMKLCKEMVEAMGGTASPHYHRFTSYAHVAYATLRKSAPLIVNLVHLMADANVPDIALDPAKAVQKVVDKFCLEVGDDDDAALRVFAAAVRESVTALFPQLMETAHKWAQYWRR
ncbi:kinase-like domain-containing protein [Blastocladiella britannica]|nr:kinase-like domain-containing protein [Blastocladiella britannica]